ncbi:MULTISPECIES: 2,3-diaminopropionate biosynthesis protein SbnB [Streptomyces]|uniref:2,3-diaminopropionate biosynthesis protein SbnB n=1 Tax=Streptomyces TaxID=1883 RepID=UPI001678DCA9|nr:MULTISPECIES: 2,3-diaminopropionate biosynthesis protein SbnB [Streptomyces]MBK3524179.1 2,3-diaminopropionate biosynthesis protein SbnB [Streptomyces sp. MBT70]GGR55125.1 2,3-diaminopropionate biosynthesis protein SbnB [Streptomyces eurythermus]
MLILRHSEVARLLDGREPDTMSVVADAYRLHERGDTAVPHSTFLRFPGQPRDRIIGLPAYRGGQRPAAGMKWIASFPANIGRGIQRASAAIILNSLETGRPEALIEGSLISAKRTAASAALAAELLTRDRRPDGLSLIGCGVINLEILRHVHAVLPGLTSLAVYDSSPERAAEFASQAASVVPGARVLVLDSAQKALAAHGLVTIATSAVEPHLDLGAAEPGTVVLHISLRDLLPESLLDAYNIVDDTEHALRERTSLDLAVRAAGHRDFIAPTIGRLLLDEDAGQGYVPEPGRTVVYAPFGLGVLDIALADHVLTAARAQGLGVRVEGFLPD